MVSQEKLFDLPSDNPPHFALFSCSCFEQRSLFPALGMLTHFLVRFVLCICQNETGKLSILPSDEARVRGGSPFPSG